jgi:hypothetical protein
MPVPANATMLPTRGVNLRGSWPTFCTLFGRSWLYIWPDTAREANYWFAWQTVLPGRIVL